MGFLKPSSEACRRFAAAKIGGLPAEIRSESQRALKLQEALVKLRMKLN